MTDGFFNDIYIDINSASGNILDKFDYDGTLSEIIFALRHILSNKSIKNLRDFRPAPSFDDEDFSKKAISIFINSKALSEFKSPDCFFKVYELLRSSTPWSAEKIECVINAFSQVLGFDIDYYIKKSKKYAYIPQGLYSYNNINVSVGDFFVSKNCVSKKDWNTYKGNKTYFSDSSNDMPIRNVSWQEAVEYCNYRSLEEGLCEFYTKMKSSKDFKCNTKSDGYRLLNVAEWMYIAGGGEVKISENHFENNQNNPFFLASMSSNAEWCFDCFDSQKNMRSVCGENAKIASGDYECCYKKESHSLTRWEALEFVNTRSSGEISKKIITSSNALGLCSGFDFLGKSNYITFRLVRNRI